ncbi:DUF4255 domain-containing protein [Paenibacillus sp. HJGM_3]|uniref:DUF4255 domain-containing protein n=1 Tax=Paenibacillus sp. HJGM_3 TaxID=3379816 RepID=UPI00385CC392
MSGDTVIADTSATLLRLLQEHMSDLAGPSSIGLQSPADPIGPNTRLTIFLYGLKENEYMRNQEPVAWGTGKLQAPPLVLDLYFMLTVHSSVLDLTERTLEEHRILGRAMKVLYDHSIIGGPYLQGGLVSSGEKLRVTLNSVSFTELSEIWNTFSDQNLKPSVCYIVSPVAIESERIHQPKRVTHREMNYTVNEAGA